METLPHKMHVPLIGKIMAALFFASFTGLTIASPLNNNVTLVRSSDTESYLELKGIITGGGNFIQEAEILIYEEDNISLYTTELTNRMGRANIQLPLNREFKLVFSKAGFLSKQITVNTHVEIKGVYVFKYSLELFEYISGLDSALVNKPVGLVRFSKADKKFEYDEAYTIMIQEELRVMYEKYNASRRPDSE